MTTLNCSNCQNLLSNSNDLAIYQQTLKSSHLTIKLEKRNQVLDKLIIDENTNEKQTNYIKSNISCSKCKTRIGKETKIGP